jgi:hypothetical protein
VRGVELVIWELEQLGGGNSEESVECLKQKAINESEENHLSGRVGGTKKGRKERKKEEQNEQRECRRMYGGNIRKIHVAKKKADN